MIKESVMIMLSDQFCDLGTMIKGI